MGSAEPAPPTFEVTALEGAWLSVTRLQLDAGRPRFGDEQTHPERARADTAPAGPLPAALRNRRLRLRHATVEVTLAQLDRALGTLPRGPSGLSDLRVWLAPDGPRLVGTFSAASRQAAFTIRPLIVAGVEGGRHARVALSDVRLFGAVPLPAPLVGVAIAGAIRAAAAQAGAAVRGAGPYLQVDPLAVALEQVLVTRGVRLPDLSWGWLESVEALAPENLQAGGVDERTARREGGGLRLRFGSAGSAARPVETGDGRARPTDRPAPLLVPTVEGQPLPAELWGAQEQLDAGALVAAEAALRAAVRADPRSLPARARLLDLRAAARGPDVLVLAGELVDLWPDFVPGWLYSGIAAQHEGDGPRAAEAFARAAELCAERGEHEDARLARAAETAARALGRRVPARAPEAAPASSTTDTADTTQQDEVPREVVSLETTLQDPGPPSFTGAGGDPVPAEQAVPTAQSPGLTDRTEQAIARGDLDEADTLFERRLAAAREPRQAATLIAERARVQLLGPDGARRALTTLRTAAPEALPEEGLVLRADLAVRAGEHADARHTLTELQARAEAAGDAAGAREAALRLDELAGAVLDDAAVFEDEMEVAEAGEFADDAEVTATVEAIYASGDDEESRGSALGTLLEGFETLEPERRHAAYSSFGRVAELAGDLEHAEEAFWRATRLPGEPARRADDLLAHAHVLLSRGNTANAIAELEEALTLVPDHAPALVLLAEQSFQARDWDNARRAYARLDGAPGAASVIDRAPLMQRRALLARAAGDATEAEGCYQEVAQLEPRDLECRRALAELALERGDARAAALHWEEVARLLPLDAVDTLLEVRQRLTDVHARLGDWGSARYYAELVLAQEPGRVATLERMVEIDEHLGLYPAAVELLERLARAHAHPRQRAAALYRQGELLLERMNEPARAFDAHLRASDLDPSHTPTSLRLIEGYWRAGDFREAAAVGDELRRAGQLADLGDLPPLLQVRWALALALGGADGTRAVSQSGLDAVAWNAEDAAAGLAEAAVLLTAREPEALEPAVALLDAWATAAASPSEAPSNGEAVQAALQARVELDPSRAGVARALAWLRERAGDALTSRALYAVATFADCGAGDDTGPTDGALAHLDGLGRAPAPTESTLAMLGPGDHPGCTGTMTPLRRALAGLAHALNGFDGPDADAAAASTSAAAPLAAAVQSDYATLARILDVPPASLIAGDDSADRPGRVLPGGMRVAGGQPPAIVLPPALLALPHDELTFLVACALDYIRSGLALVDHATDGTGTGVGALLDGARAALTGDVPAPDGLAGAVAEALTDVERRAALLGPVTVGAMLEDLERARALVGAWGTFRDAVERAADRFAVLACRNPLGALRALFRLDGGDPSATTAAERARRAAFLRGGRVRELVKFVVSPDYAAALRAGDADA